MQQSEVFPAASREGIARQTVKQTLQKKQEEMRAHNAGFRFVVGQTVWVRDQRARGSAVVEATVR